MHLPEQPFATLLTFWGGVEQSFWAFNLNPEDYAWSIKAPVLLQWGKNDKRVTQRETVAVFKGLASDQKQLVVYNESGHESLLKKEPQKWLTTVKAFLDK